MDQKTEDAGTIAALMIRFSEYRLPRAQRMLNRVNAGELLNDSDIAFLKLSLIHISEPTRQYCQSSMPSSD